MKRSPSSRPPAKVGSPNKEPGPVERSFKAEITISEMRAMSLDELRAAFDARRFPVYVSWDDLMKMRGG